MQERWSAVDRYFADRLAPSDAVLDAVVAANAAAGLPPHDVSPLQGRFLEILVRLTRFSTRYWLRMSLRGCRHTTSRRSRAASSRSSYA